MSDEKLLKEITDNFDYCVREWREVREEGRTDMRFIAGDPWDPKERAARKASGRPCVALDELSQYVNQRINDVRQNKRAVKITPKGNGASDQTAEFRGGMIRDIEYKSNAQAAYITAFENAIQRSYGYAKVSTQYVAPDSFEQELVIRRVPNPDTIYLDPDAKEVDSSDMGYGFEIDTMPVSKFRKQWPDAQILNFSPEIIEQAPAWLREDRVQVAAYWKVEKKFRNLVLLENGKPLFLDEIPGAKIQKGFCLFPDGARLKVINQRRTEDQTVCQYITNGVEILEENPWAGKWIPIIPCWGKEMYVDDGSGSKRILLSLVRLARDPYMAYCYARTCQIELVGMTPKIPLMGYEGQFATNTDLENINKVPLAYAEVKATTTDTGQAVLPLPQRQEWNPPIQSLELLCESTKRAIQSAVGMFNSSVGRQDSAAKSGIAIKALDLQSDQTNYHFISNYDRFLAHVGRVLDDSLEHVYDTPREVGSRKPDETHTTVRINQPYNDPQTGQPTHNRTDQGDHDITISTGPSYQSQREEASDFADTLAQNQHLFPLIADLVVKLKDLGPIGDEIAKRLTPPQFQSQDGQQPIPPQAAAKMQKYEQLIDSLTKEVQTLSEELRTKRLELASKERQVAIQADATVTSAEIKANSQENIEQLRADIGRIEQHIELMFRGMALDQGTPAPPSSPAPATPAAPAAPAQPPTNSQ